MANVLNIQITKAKVEMKKQAMESRGRPGQILADAFASNSLQVRAAGGCMDTVKRNIRRQRRGALPKEPASLREFVLDADWKTTGGK